MHRSACRGCSLRLGTETNRELAFSCPQFYRKAFLLGLLNQCNTLSYLGRWLMRGVRTLVSRTFGWLRYKSSPCRDRCDKPSHAARDRLVAADPQPWDVRSGSSVV